jgi:putative ABC transport system permease protein
MNFIEVVKTSKKAVLSNKIRSSLTMLGVIIGVSAVILLIAIGRGVQNYITDQFAALGSNLVFIMPGKGFAQNGPPSGLNKLEDKHIKILENQTGDLIDKITPEIVANKTLSYRNEDFLGSLIGLGNEGPAVFNFEVKDGRLYSQAEANAGERVVVIGPVVKDKLFGSADAVGKKIKIDDKTFTVVGVFKEKSQSFDDSTFMPRKTIENELNAKTFLAIVIKIKDEKNIARNMKAFERALLRDLKPDDFTVQSQSEILGSIQSIVEILTIGLGSIAGISLLVGGIGIMNIMLVSVTERTREIGLRKALGATSNNIALQFLIESIMLSVGGGVIGIILGWLLAFIPRTYIRTEVTWWAVLLAFGFSAAVGILFGTYPAMKASKKDPIEALRYE